MRIILFILVFVAVVFGFRGCHYMGANARSSGWLLAHHENGAGREEIDTREAIEKGKEMADAFHTSTFDLLSFSAIAFILGIAGLIYLPKTKSAPVSAGTAMKRPNQARDATE